MGTLVLEGKDLGSRPLANFVAFSFRNHPACPSGASVTDRKVGWGHASSQ